ncbi:MAG: SCP2 sterol-binding domain-containing protein [Archaeoglobaceae archaeon]|nr:SCP2 sterol-binding domain-containing protein [Archaeoglobaceae archaeon]MDW8117646.1 SCP2 sterol-binding domain-containing protein [Archaeoglobaceae archaeon]
MAVVFPSKEWMDELLKKINSDETYKKVAANWEGDFLCKILLDNEALKDFQNPEKLAGFISMMAMIPKDKLMNFKGRAEEKLLNKLGVTLDPKLDFAKLNANELAKKIANIKLEEVQGAASYVWMDFWHGQLRNLEVVTPGEKENARFKLTGPYSVFKQMVGGKADPITLIVGGKIKLQGDMGYMMRNMASVKRFTELMASVPIK